MQSVRRVLSGVSSSLVMPSVLDAAEIVQHLAAADKPPQELGASLVEPRDQQGHCCAGAVERSASEGNIVLIQGGSMLVNLSQAEAVATLNLMPLSCGLQQLPPLTLLDQTRAVVIDTLALSVLVEPAAG